MSEVPAPTLLRLLGRVLWFLLRLVLYAAFGQWIETKAEREKKARKLVGGPAHAEPAKRGAPSRDLAQLARWIDGLGHKAEQVRADARAVIGGRSIEATLAAVIAPDLEAARAASARGELDARGADKVAALAAALSLLETSVEARRDARVARAFADREAIAVDLLDPMRAHLEARGGMEHVLRPVAVPRTDVRAAQLVASHTRLVPIALRADEPPDQSLAHTARVIAARLTPWLVPGLLLRHRLPPALFAPPPYGTYDADTARAALGAWFSELAADGLATFMVGPAYARVLARSLSRTDAPFEVRRGYLHGRWLSAQPPSLVRVFVAMRALEALGFHGDAEALWGGFTRAHAAEDVLLLPLADGRLVPIPAGFLLSELEPLLEDLFESQHEELLGHALSDVPGFAYSHGEHGEARDAAARFSRGETAAYDPRVLLSAALLAFERGAERAVVSDALARSLRGEGTLEGTYAAPPAAEKPPARASSLRELARDPAALREAIVLSAAFSRPRGREFPSGLAQQPFRTVRR